MIARNSSFIYKGKAVDVRQVGRELGVGYVLEGSVRRRDDRLRITAQLIEASAGTHLWADRFDGSMNDVFELQDRIAETAAAVIEPKVRFAEAERVRRRAPQNLDAYQLWLRAISHAGEFTPDSMTAAMRCLDQALELEPTYALAMASNAYYYAHCYLQGWIKHSDDRRARVIGMASEAIEIGDNDANVLWQSAFAVWILEQDGPRALELFRRALQVNPNSAIALAMAGWVEAINGDPVEGKRLLQRSQRLSPLHPQAWFAATGMALACISDHDHAGAVIWAQKALAQNRRFSVALRVLAVALVNTGEIDKARKIAAEVMKIEPQLTVSSMRTRLPLTNHAVFENYREALRKAGVPD